MQMTWIMYTLDLSHCHTILSLTLSNSSNPKPKEAHPSSLITDFYNLLDTPHSLGF